MISKQRTKGRGLRFFIRIFWLVALVAGPVLGQPRPDCWGCRVTVEMPNAGSSEVALFVLPDGSGSPFSQAQVRGDGSVVDAHIELIFLDSFGNPVSNFPAGDLRLDSGDNGLVSCPGGITADTDTDQDGFTSWETPLHAGGSSEALLYIHIESIGVDIDGIPLALAFNSADMNGDGIVNLADVGQFSNSYFSEYAFEADFFADGVLNLADVARLAFGMGGSCQ